ncbi:hypothetical protein MRX96_004549 [Rhipicephalus microplus]
MGLRQGKNHEVAECREGSDFGAEIGVVHFPLRLCATRTVVLAACDGATRAVTCQPPPPHPHAWGLGHGRIVFKFREDAASGQETDYPGCVRSMGGAVGGHLPAMVHGAEA